MSPAVPHTAYGAKASVVVEVWAGDEPPPYTALAETMIKALPGG